MQDQEKYTFKFLSYYFNKNDLTATFCYQGIDNVIFTEQIIFDKNPEEGKEFNVLNDETLNTLLDRALFLAYILSGTSYYKAHPTPFVRLEVPIDDFQAAFFSRVYQEGLSQFAFENNLVRNNLAHFYATENYEAPAPIPAESYKGKGNLSMQSGGKDSLLVAEMLNEANIDFTPWYVSSSAEKTHPAVIDNLYESLKHRTASICVRQIDLGNLQRSGGLNGHVPVTLILESLALVQAILNNDDVILTSIGQEGEEPHSMIGDLPVNHQWSKTWAAEQMLTQYVERYISPALHIGSPIRHMSEMRVSGEFVDKCWVKYGYQFSSCNKANYGQLYNNKTLTWCGQCPKCANAYLLFCPFLAPHQLQSLFHDVDLFTKPELTDTFKGLLGVENHEKPFECIGSIDELRTAYQNRMHVDPIPIDDLPVGQRAKFEATDFISEESVGNLAQASERLGLNKILKNKEEPKVNYIGQNRPKVIKLYQPLYADLPFVVPEGHFEYEKDYPANPFFKDFIKTHAGSLAEKEKAKKEAEEAEKEAAEKRKEQEENYREKFGVREYKRNKPRKKK